MSILPSHLIGARINDGSLRIEPWSAAHLQPSSVDLRLGRYLLIAAPDGFYEHDLVEDGRRIVRQHGFVLAATLERICIPDDLVGVLVGKSTLARQGLQVEAAGYVDPGWRGNLTLELVHLAPQVVVLEHGMLICQIRFETLTEPCTRPYGSPGLKSHYQNSDRPVAAVTETRR